MGLLEHHLGRGMILRSDPHDEWTPKYHEEHRRPIAGCPDSDQLRSEVVFTHPEIDFEDAYLAAEATSEGLRFTPNEALNNLGVDGSGADSVAESPGNVCGDENWCGGSYTEGGYHPTHGSFFCYVE